VRYACDVIFYIIDSNLGLKNSELDPHGAYGDGNPIGGNVTSNITGSDQHFAEWMVRELYLSLHT